MKDEKKFTPGPWRAWDVTDNAVRGFSHIILSERGAIGYSPLPKDHPLGYTRYEEADAKLIAAAPDLLEALQYLLSLPCLQPHRIGFASATENAVDAAHNAINKATK